MNTFALRGTGFFEWILQTSWQAAVLAALILLTQWLFRKRLSPGWRYGLWFLLVARLLLPASPQSAFSLFNLTRAAQTAAVTRDEAEPAPLPQTSPEPLPGHDIPGAAAETTSESPGQAGIAAIPSLDALTTAQDGTYNAAATTSSAAAVTGKRIEWIPLAVIAWFTGVCFFALRLIGTNILFARRLRGHSAASARVRQVLEQCQSAVNWRNPVVIIETGAVNTPAVWGLRRKVLLLPEGMADQFSDDELRHILLHELAHLKRRDLEVNWLVTVLQVLHWFNPVLWFAFRRMRADRELATDALALSCGRGRENIPYGETILKVLEGVGRGPVLPGLVGIAESKTQIKERLIAIATHGKFRPWNAAAVAALAIIGVLTLTDAKQAAPDSKAGATNSVADSSSTKQNIDGRKRFEIRVIEYETSRPVADTKVRFEFDYYSKPSRTEERLTSADGIAAIEFETADVSRFAYRVQKDGYLAPRGDWLKNQVALAPERFELEISQGTEIGGKVTDENGKPVAGAEILFDRPINMIMSANEADYPIVSRKWSVFGGESVAVTDAAGQWRARCIYPTITMAPLRVRHPDFAEAPYSTETGKAMEAQGKGHAVQFDDLLHKRAVFKLSPGESVTGKVVDDAGAPVSRVLVRYADRPSENPFWDDVMGKGTVTTDSNGAFRIAHLPPKRIFFTVQMPGYAPTVKELDPGSAPREVELRLSKGRKLLGQVVDDRENRPISGARLKFNDWSIWQGVKWDGVTDSDGRFQWERAPAQKFQVHAEREGYIAQDKTLESNEEQVIRLKPVLKVSGEVVDSSNRKPIERFRICWGDRNDRIEDLSRNYSVTD